MDKMTKKIMGTFSAIIIVAIVIIAGFYFLNRKAQQNAQQEKLPTTEVGKILDKDLEGNYPATPTEVVKLYWRINCCLYNLNMTDSQFENVLKQLRKLYDDEMLNGKGNSFKSMLAKFKKEREKRERTNGSISSYVVQKNDSVIVKNIKGKDCTTIISSVLLKEKGKTEKTYENFICRKDDSGKWKILGWKQTTADVGSGAGVE